MQQPCMQPKHVQSCCRCLCIRKVFFCVLHGQLIDIEIPPLMLSGQQLFACQQANTSKVADSAVRSTGMAVLFLEKFEICPNQHRIDLLCYHTTLFSYIASQACWLKAAVCHLQRGAVQRLHSEANAAHVCAGPLGAANAIWPAGS